MLYKEHTSELNWNSMWSGKLYHSLLCVFYEKQGFSAGVYWGIETKELLSNDSSLTQMGEKTYKIIQCCSGQYFYQEDIST